MSAPLLQVQSHLAGFAFTKSSPATTARLAEALQVADPTSNEAGQLPAELLETLLVLLSIPRACIMDDDDLDASSILAKERFLNQSPSLLALSLSLVRLLPPAPFDVDFRNRLLLGFARFTRLEQSEGFTSLVSSQLSSEICSLLLATPDRYNILRHVLSKTFPPLFKPHPKLNPSTGRVLSRPQGGANAMADWYDESDEDTCWRYQAGLGNVVNVVVGALERNEMEDSWPLLLPPLLAYLDDHDASKKIVGTSILQTLLERVDSGLLVRTGVGKVFEQSLRSSFTALSSPLSSPLLTATHRVILNLLPLLHKTPETLSTALFSVLSGGIILPWSFKSGNVPIELSLTLALPPILNLLGTPSVRFLPILIPHLCSLLEVGVNDDTLELLIAATKALLAVVVQGKPRIPRWRGVVLSSVGKCWVSLKEGGEGGVERRVQLELALRKVVAAVGLEEDLVAFKALDPLFAPLVVAPATVLV